MISRGRFALAVAAVAFVLTLPAVLLFSSRLAGEQEREFLQRSEWMAKNFADQVWLQLRSSQDQAKLTDVINAMVNDFVVMDPVIYAQVVLQGELVAQHHHLGDAPVEQVLALPERAAARRLERKRLDTGLEYLDIWRGIEPERTNEPVESYIRLGVSLAPLLTTTETERWLALLWGAGFVLVLGGVAYWIWPWWARMVHPHPHLLSPARGRRAKGEGAGGIEGEVLVGNERSLQFGPLIIDDHAKEVRLNGATLPLTPREYALIRLLASEPGKVFSAQEIIERAWGTERFISGEDVKKYIYLLRQKVERDPQNPQAILTVRGFGYKFVPPSQ